MIYWVTVRCFNKSIRHLYNVYCATGLKFTLYSFEFMRTTSFYAIYLAEYVLINILVYEALPVVEKIELPQFASKLQSIDCKFFYILFLCIVMPHFVRTYIQLHRKRQKTLVYAWNKSAKRI